MLLPELGIQESVTACGMEAGVDGAVAVPDRLMDRAAPEELVSFKEPVLFPAARGWKVTWKESCWPALRVVPPFTPDMEKAAPVIAVEPIVTGEFPVLLTLTLWVLVPCTAIAGKEREAGVSCQDSVGLMEVPLTGTVTGEVASLLAIEMVALAEVVTAVGVKLTVKFLLALGASLRGAITVPSEKPVPVKEMAVMSRSAFPLFAT